MPDEGKAELAPGSVVRFQVVGGDGSRGSSWSARTALKMGDVYLAHREGGRWVHTSLHHDGRWHFALSDAGQDLAPDAPRYLNVTTDRAELAPGWLHAVRLTVAASELRSRWREAGKVHPLVEVPLSEGFDAVSVDLLLGAPTAAAVRPTDSLLVAKLRRGDGGTALIVARPTMLDAPIGKALARPIAEAVAGLREHGWDGTSPTRLVIIGGDAGSYLRQVEIAVDADTDP